MSNFEISLYTVAKIRSSKIKYELGLFQKLNEINLSNSKSWWHTRKTIMEKKHIINSPLSINGELIDNLKKADLFNDYFIKQSSIDESNVRIFLAFVILTYRLKLLNRLKF